MLSSCRSSSSRVSCEQIQVELSNHCRLCEACAHILDLLRDLLALVVAFVVLLQLLDRRLGLLDFRLKLAVLRSILRGPLIVQRLLQTRRSS